MIKGLLLGSASALALSALFVSAVTLIVPPPERNTRLATPVPAVPVQLDQVESLPRVPDRPSDPVQVAQREEPTSNAAVPRVDLPAASEFNRPPEDGAVVTPSAERSQRPAPVSEGLRSGVAPTDTVLAETQSAAQPLPSVISGFGAVPEAGDAPAVPRVSSEDAPQTFGVVTSGEDESALPENLATTQPEPVVTAQAEPEAIEPDPVVPEPAPVVVEPEPVAEPEPEPVVVAEPDPVVPETAPVVAEPEVKAPNREILLAEAPDAVLDETAPIVVGVAPLLVEQPTQEEPRAQQEPAQVEEIIPQPQDLAEETEAVAIDVPTAAPTVSEENLADDGAVETAEAAPAEAAPAEAPSEATEDVARVTPVEDVENTPQTAADRARAAITFVENPVVPPRAEPEVAEETGPVVLPRRLVLDSARQDGAGQDSDPEDGEPPQTDEVADGEEAVPEGPTVALVDFAAAFDNPDDLPLMSVVLIDDPSFDVAREDLIAFDFPVTFAIDPTRSDAAAAAAAYRAAGHEVVALAEIFPTGATAQDIEVAMSAMRQALPEAIGILDRASNGIVGNRTSLGALLPPMQEAGMGLLAYPDGLNSGVGTAQRAGVPATTLYRVLGEGNERAPVIVRFLDRATFEAAQDGATVVLGRANSETVTALYSWRLGNRADQVVPAPLSAVLLAVSGS